MANQRVPSTLSTVAVYANCYLYIPQCVNSRFMNKVIAQVKEN